MWLAWESCELEDCESLLDDAWWLWLSFEDFIFLLRGWKSTDGTWKTPSQTIWELPEPEDWELPDPCELPEAELPEFPEEFSSP